MLSSSLHAFSDEPRVFQILLSKYNQQYHKLFKDIPSEEVVLKGELWSPWDQPWESPVGLEAQTCSLSPP